MVIPVPIPNTEVKHAYVPGGTALCGNPGKLSVFSHFIKHVTPPLYVLLVSELFGEAVRGFVTGCG